MLDRARARLAIQRHRLTLPPSLVLCEHYSFELWSKIPMEPLTLIVNGSTVSVTADGVPKFGVVKVGDVAKTAAPVPVSSVSAAARFAEVGVPRNVATPVPTFRMSACAFRVACAARWSRPRRPASSRSTPATRRARRRGRVVPTLGAADRNPPLRVRDPARLGAGPRGTRSDRAHRRVVARR